MQYQIQKFKWGKIKIDGIVFKDVLLSPDKYNQWDWKICGTKHSPGITKDAVENLYKLGAITMVLSGMQEKLELSPEAKLWLENNKVTYFYLQTEKAVAKYNELIGRSDSIGALIHSTC